MIWLLLGCVGLGYIIATRNEIIIFIKMQWKKWKEKLKLNPYDEVELAFENSTKRYNLRPKRREGKVGVMVIIEVMKTNYRFYVGFFMEK